MTQKEAEEILLAAGWTIFGESFSFRTWISPNGRNGVDVWLDNALDDHARSWRRKENSINFAKIPPELLYPKDVADVLRHCS